MTSDKFALGLRAGLPAGISLKLSIQTAISLCSSIPAAAMTGHNPRASISVLRSASHMGKRK
jgi:hypothetical protein